ncbi:MAG: Fe-S protein assembly co-chaperone HscB [Saprospiraceae bacterium]|nr:Fe-S protein assembly co-chaperone HscB [Saprospiraceae bacterium]
MNYFEHFGIPMSFLIDEGELKKKYLAMSRQLHPDFYTLEDHITQEIILEKSSLNNEAYKVLKDPMSRMKYILELTGHLEAEGEQSIPQDFLMEMMDINESLMELSMDPNPEGEMRIREEIASIEDGLKADVEPIFKEYETAPDSTDLTIVKEFYFKSKYLLRLKENLDKFASP